ncbi:WD40-repeat-containing domain protein [Hysterangium stoloniferum]|nr:WD40-repeat-containing domain protein [Hysterangium stoloniferum]
MPDLATTQALAWAAHAQSHLPHLSLPDLESLISHLTPAQFAHLNANLRYSRRRDFLSDLPPELALHILGFVDEARSVLSAGRVCKRWSKLVNDEASSHTTEYNWMHHSSSTLLRTHRSPDSCVVTSLAMDDTYIVVGLANGRAHVFSVRTGMLVRTLVGHEAGVCAGCDKQVRVWDVKTGLCLYILRGHRSTVRCLKMFHGRPIAVSGGRDHTVRIWDVRRGLLLKTLEGHTDSVRCLDVYGDRVVSGSYDCTVRLWNVTTGACLRVFNGHYHQVYTVAFDGERIVSGGLDTCVRVWDVESGTCLALLQGHTALVCQLQLSVRTNTIISGSADGRQQDPYRIIARLTAHSSSITGLQMDDGPGTRGKKRWLISGGGDGRVLLWDVAGVVDSLNLPVSTSTSQPTIPSPPTSSSKASRPSSPPPEPSSNPLPANPSPTLIRALTAPCEGLWKVAFRGNTTVVCCLRGGRTVLEVWGFGGGAGIEAGL